MVQRPIDLDGLIDYGFLGWLSRPLAIPILQAITSMSSPAVTASRSFFHDRDLLALLSAEVALFKAMKKAQKLAPK